MIFSQSGVLSYNWHIPYEAGKVPLFTAAIYAGIGRFFITSLLI
jgi:hypothetical protein